MGLITDVPEPVPPGRFSTWRSGWFARRSSIFFTIAMGLALAAAALTLRERQMRRDFAEPTASSMGAVRSSGALLGSRRKSSEWFCWVSYEFTPAGGAPQRNWRLWEHGCGVSGGRPIHIQYVVARPEVNRPAGEDGSLSPLVVWFAAGMMLVIGTLVRNAQDGD